MRLPLLATLIFIVLATLAVKWLAPEWLTPRTQDGSFTGEALIGGSFKLTDHRGQPFTDKDIKGQYSLIYFGFTHCPDICPTTLLVVANALNNLAEQGTSILPVFITVDPKRDTVAALANYVSNFHPRLVGLTGTQEEINATASAYKVYHQIVEDKDSALGYQVDHSGFLYLMSPEGRYVKHFPHTISEQALTDALKQAIR